MRPRLLRLSRVARMRPTAARQQRIPLLRMALPSVQRRGLLALRAAPMPRQIAEAAGRDSADAEAGLGREAVRAWQAAREQEAARGQEAVPEVMEAGAARGASNKFK